MVKSIQTLKQETEENQDCIIEKINSIKESDKRTHSGDCYSAGNKLTVKTIEFKNSSASCENNLNINENSDKKCNAKEFGSNFGSIYSEIKNDSLLDKCLLNSRVLLIIIIIITLGLISIFVITFTKQNNEKSMIEIERALLKLSIDIMSIQTELNNSQILLNEQLNNVKSGLSEIKADMNSTDTSLKKNREEINFIKNIKIVDIEHEANATNLYILEIEKQAINLKTKLVNIENDNELAKDKLKEFEDSMNVTKTNLENNIKRIDSLEYNTVPVGFIYFQLPDQSEPSNIWSYGVWTEISSQYAGLFFRVLGGTSEHFGVLQNENSNRLTNVASKIDDSFRNFDITVNPGVWSDWITLGAWKGDNLQTRFFQSAGEIRPKNMAFRIWRRIS